jgi:hypothetical protein
MATVSELWFDDIQMRDYALAALASREADMQEAKDCIERLDLENHRLRLASPAPVAPTPENAAYLKARDAILYDRGPLEGEGLTGEQTNAVLAVLDDAFSGAPVDPTSSRAIVNLEGLADRLLAPRAIVRDKDGYLIHPEMPACDENVRTDVFLSAFGLDTGFVGMEGDCDDEEFMERVHEGESCLAWSPTPPEGDGWVLLEIYPTEDGPYAMFARVAKPPMMSRRRAAKVDPTPEQEAHRLLGIAESSDGAFVFHVYVKEGESFYDRCPFCASKDVHRETDARNSWACYACQKRWGERAAAVAPTPAHEDALMVHPGPWRVALFKSSAFPDKRIRVLSEGEKEIAEHAADKDFLGWLALAPVAPVATTPAQPSDAQRKDMLMAARYLSADEGEGDVLTSTDACRIVQTLFDVGNLDALVRSESATLPTEPEGDAK